MPIIYFLALLSRRSPTTCRKPHTLGVILQRVVRSILKLRLFTAFFNSVISIQDGTQVPLFQIHHLIESNAD